MEAFTKLLVRMLSELTGRDTDTVSDAQLQNFGFDLFLFDVIKNYPSYIYVTQSQSNTSAHTEPVTVPFGLLMYKQALEYGLIHRYNRSANS